MKKNFKKLNSAIAKLEAARIKYKASLDAVACELQELTGKEIVYNDFPGDGLGVMTVEPGEDPGSVNNYMSISQAVSLIEEKGTIDKDDRTYY